MKTYKIIQVIITIMASINALGSILRENNLAFVGWTITICYSVIAYHFFKEMEQYKEEENDGKEL